MTTISRVEVDTGGIDRDLTELRNYLQTTRQHIKQLKGYVDTMNRMWEGAAKTVMSARFQSDYNNMHQFCQQIEEFLNNLDTINKKYKVCEKAVSGIVNVLRV